MKRIAAAVFFVLASTVALAHSGSTDSMGCHTDSLTGVRHCH